jgi:hypothetical protein
MKIAQIAPLMESVPPRLYGGTERVVSYLVEQLVALGHDVTLFGSADSVNLRAPRWLCDYCPPIRSKRRRLHSILYVDA